MGYPSTFIFLQTCLNRCFYVAASSLRPQNKQFLTKLTSCLLTHLLSQLHGPRHTALMETDALILLSDHLCKCFAFSQQKWTSRLSFLRHAVNWSTKDRILWHISAILYNSFASIMHKACTSALAILVPFYECTPPPLLQVLSLTHLCEYALLQRDSQTPAHAVLESFCAFLVTLASHRFTAISFQHHLIIDLQLHS